MKINIIGAGTWAIALTSLFEHKDYNITLYHRNSKHSNILKRNRIHPYLFNYTIPDNVKFSTNIKEATAAEYVIVAIPSNAINDIFLKYKLNDSNLIIATKGYDKLLGKQIHA